MGGEVPNVGQSGELQGPGSRLMRGLPTLDRGRVLNTEDRHDLGDAVNAGFPQQSLLTPGACGRP